MPTSEIRDHFLLRGGLARTSSLTKAGVTRRRLARAVRAGDVVRIREGVYALSDAEAAVVEAARHGGGLACASALVAHGVWTLEKPEVTHVWLGSKGRAHAHRACRCVDHHDAGSPTFGVVPLRLALVQAAKCCSDETFFAAVESALQLELISDSDLHWIRRRVRTGSQALIDAARSDAGSGIESIFALRLLRLGIELESQVSIPEVGVVDFRFGMLLFEIDGRANHDGQSKRHEDLVRDAEAAALGYETLRFDYAQIVHDWPSVERAVLARIGVSVAGSRVLRSLRGAATR